MATPQKSQMLAHVLQNLRLQVQRCDHSIHALVAELERRSPNKAATEGPRARSRVGWTPAKREEVSRRMRAFWADRRAPRDAPESLAIEEQTGAP